MRRRREAEAGEDGHGGRAAPEVKRWRAADGTGANVSDALRKGREAFDRHAWGEAYAALAAAADAAPLGIADLERLAAAAYLVGHDEASARVWTRAHAECVRLRDIPRAARCAFWLVLDLLDRGEAAQADGWIARAQRLLDDAGHDRCPERGLLFVLLARAHAQRGETEAAEEAARRGAALASGCDDPELGVFARLILAQLRARRGDVAATALLDEVMVAVTMGDVSPVAVGTVYCAVIGACQQLFDVARAREWTAALSRWCDAQPDMIRYRGQCLVHRVEVMRLAGAWSQAMREAEQACEWLTRRADAERGVHPERIPPRFKYPLGAAFYELGELRRMRGALEDAERAYREASRHGRPPEPGMALLRLAEGRVDAALAAIRRVLDDRQGRLARAAALAAAVEILLAARDRPAARAAAEELVVLADAVPVPYLRARAAEAIGSVLLAEDDARGAVEQLRAAWAAWQAIEAPHDAARVRVLLARAFGALGDADAAELELDAARRVFEGLAAAPDLARVEAMARAGAREEPGALTPREREVIRLVASGRTNRGIAEALAISERTVDRHVSNILTKLDLPSRSAATAYAYEHGLM